MNVQRGQHRLRRPVAALAVAALVAAAPAPAQTVERVARIGNNTEDATLIYNGHFATQVAVLDGYDVFAIPVEGAASGEPRKLFDVKAIDELRNPRGIVHVPSTRAFYFLDPSQPTLLFATDEDGVPQSPIELQFPGTFDASSIGFVEGLTYLPHDSPFPDRIARIVFVLPFFEPVIEVLTTDGVVERRIPLGPPGVFTDPFGLEWLSARDAFAVSQHDEVLTVSPDGMALPDVTVVPQAFDVEALVGLRDGRLVAGDYAAGQLVAYDRLLDRAPAGDRPYRIGLGLSLPFHAVWDPVTSAFATIAFDRDLLQDVVAGVSATLESKQVLFTLSGTRTAITRIPADDTFAMCGLPFRGIEIYSRAGELVSTVPFSPTSGVPRQRCTAITYLSAIDAYAVRLLPSTFARSIFLVSRTGELLNRLDLSFPVFSLSTPPDGAGDRILVWTAPATVTELDLSGAVLSTFNAPTAGLRFPGGFAAGPGGSFALFDPFESGVAIERP